MSRLGAVGERINVFRVDDRYLFVHYFGDAALFKAFGEYYDDGAYRFEVPAAAFEDVRARLEASGFDPVVVGDPAPYGVVKEQYTTHAAILRNSVLHWERRGHLFFVLKDEVAVEAALEAGAVRLEETEFALGI